MLGTKTPTRHHVGGKQRFWGGHASPVFFSANLLFEISEPDEQLQNAASSSSPSPANQSVPNSITDVYNYRSMVVLSFRPSQTAYSEIMTPIPGKP